MCYRRANAAGGTSSSLLIWLNGAPIYWSVILTACVRP
jgi:hypothetical protein